MLQNEKEKQRGINDPLNLWSNQGIPALVQELLCILFTAAKGLLAGNWKNNSIPTVEDWFVKCWDCNSLIVHRTTVWFF